MNAPQISATSDAAAEPAAAADGYPNGVATLAVILSTLREALRASRDREGSRS